MLIVEAFLIVWVMLFFPWLLFHASHSSWGDFAEPVVKHMLHKIAPIFGAIKCLVQETWFHVCGNPWFGWWDEKRETTKSQTWHTLIGENIPCSQYWSFNLQSAQTYICDCFHILSFKETVFMTVPAKLKQWEHATWCHIFGFHHINFLSVRSNKPSSVLLSNFR